MEIELSKIKLNDINSIVTEQDVRALLSDFIGYVISRNISECKKFIRDFVKEVIVYKEDIEVISNVSFYLLKRCISNEEAPQDLINNEKVSDALITKSNGDDMSSENVFVIESYKKK